MLKTKLLFVFVGALAATAITAKPVVRAVENDGRVIEFTTEAPRTFSGPLLDTPPAAPLAPRLDREEDEIDGQLDAPFVEADGDPVFSDAVETAPSRAPGDIVLLRNQLVVPSAGNVSAVAEPSVGSQGDGIFETYNWYASLTTNNFQTRSFISPYTMFPNSPAPFAAGFCCDQRVIQDSTRNLIFWFLQYIKTGATANDTNGLRVAVARGQNGLGTNTWSTYDFTPEQLGLTESWFDFPHMQASANFLYFTVNIFGTIGNNFKGSAIFKVSMDQINNNQPLTVQTFFTPSYGSLLAVNGAAAEGNRPGRTTMYFASVIGGTSIRILRWPEADAQPTVSDVTGLATTQGGTFVCTAPDSTNPCARANTRAQGGWITDTELGIMWVSAQIAPNRPFPFTRVAILNPETLAVISQPDIFSAQNAFLYPIVAINQRGHLGGMVDNLGGNIFPTVRLLIRDDLSPDVVTNGWESLFVGAGNGGTGSWGDYNGATIHEKYPSTWLGTGRVQIDGARRIQSFWFGRERDARPTLSVTAQAQGGTGSVSSVPAGINCGASCSAMYDLGTVVTLTATAGANSIFEGWQGACAGTGSCQVTIDEAKSVTARFGGADRVFRNGFEPVQ